MSTISAPADAVLPTGSLVLVTGVNGFIGAHVADQLLKHGYRVRGVVRRNVDWMNSTFDQKYGKGKFETFQVQDVAQEELLVPAMKDVSGVIHLASDVSFSPDPTALIPLAVNLATAVLKAAARSPDVSRFVLCSSAMAASSYKPNVAHDIKKGDYAEDYIEMASKPPPYGPEMSAATYGASKAMAEKAVWKWAQENETRSKIVVNTVLPDFNCGLPISPENQGWPSTAGAIKALFDGNVTEGFHGRILPPQQHVAVQDVALLHIAALINPTARNERVFGFAEPKTANKALAIFRKLYPDRKFPEHDPNEGEDLTNVIEKPRAEELLRWIAGREWISFHDSLKEMGDYLVAH